MKALGDTATPNGGDIMSASIEETAWVDCPVCHGHGETCPDGNPQHAELCGFCGGEGEVEGDVTLDDIDDIDIDDLSRTRMAPDEVVWETRF